MGNDHPLLVRGRYSAASAMQRLLARLQLAGSLPRLIAVKKGFAERKLRVSKLSHFFHVLPASGVGASTPKKI
jgi:hypothetical protein